MTTSGLTAVKNLISTYRPLWIQVSPTESANSYLWEFSFPSALLVTVVLSGSESLTMGDVVGSILGPPKTLENGCGTQLTVFELPE